MAIANVSRAMIFTQTRQLLGATDASKGGPTDAQLYDNLNGTIRRFVTEAGALETVWKLSTKANDKYVPLEAEILWPKTVVFIDASGNQHPLSIVEYAPSPPSTGGLPSVCWLTAVNVPDVSGPSVRSLGIDPPVGYNGTGNILLEAFQLSQDLAADADYPELHASIQSWIPYAFALDLLPIFPERLNMEGYFERQRARGLDAFRKLSRSAAKAPFTGKETIPYRQMARSRF